MKLNTLERIVLAQVLPHEGTFANLRLLRVLRESLSFNEEENKALGFRQEGTQMMWNNDEVVDGEVIPRCPERDFPIGEVLTKLIVEKLKELNSQAKLTEQHFSLYEKFIVDES